MMDPNDEESCFYTAEMLTAWQNTPGLQSIDCDKTILLQL